MVAPTKLRAPRAPRFKRHSEFLEWWDGLSERQKDLAAAKCRDPKDGFVYFVDNFCWIKSSPEEFMFGEKDAGWMPAKGLIQMRLWSNGREEMEAALRGEDGFDYTDHERALLEHALERYQCSQVEALADVLRYNLVYFLKVRQIGLTWLAAFRLIHTCCFFPHQDAALISLEKDQRARALGDRALLCFNNLPEDLHGLSIDESAWGHSLRRWSNDSCLRILSTTEFGAASFDLTAAVVDEVCLIQERSVNVNELIKTGIVETLRMNHGWGWFISTGRGRAGHFYDNTKRLEKEQYDPPRDFDDAALVFLPSTAHPMWTPKRYFSKRRENGGDPVWVREHPMNIDEAFSASGLSVFNARRVEERIRLIDNGQAPIYPERVSFLDSVETERFRPKLDDHGEARLYHKYKTGHVYSLMVDPSEGQAKGDWTAITVIDATDNQLACVVQIKLNDEDSIGELSYRIGRYYGWALIIPEINKFRGVLKWLQRHSYPTLYYHARPSAESPTDAENFREYGWRTNTGKAAGSKDLAEAALKEQLKQPPGQATLEVWDRGILEEALTYIEVYDEKTGEVKYRGAPKNTKAHDDMLVSLMVNWYVVSDFPDHLPSPVTETDEEWAASAIYTPSEAYAGDPGWKNPEDRLPSDWQTWDSVEGAL